MKGSTRAARHAAAVAFLAVLGAACGGSPDAGPDPEDDTSAAAVPTSEPTAATAEGPSEPPATHAGPEIPATSAGPLTRRDFPRPAELGSGWSYRVDSGDAEEGYTGNDTPVLERDPAEVRLLAVPFGCPRPAQLPMPDHALEVDYTAGEVPVVAVRASFGDVRTARRFHTVRARLLRTCQGTVVVKAEGMLVREVRRVSATALLNDRTPDSDPWAELAVHDGDQVVLVAARARLDGPPLTPDAVTDLARAFRR